MAAGNPQFEERIYAAVEAENVLPDPTRIKRYSWTEVARLVPKVKEVPKLIDKEKINRLTSMVNKEKRDFSDLSEEIWPPRTKTDMSLRRTRLWDYYLYMKGRNRLEELREIMYNTREGWDIIFVTNIIVWYICAGDEVYKRWVWLGAYDGDLSHYLAVTKKVSDLIKTRGIIDKDSFRYLESSTLAGYRNPPFPGFDVVKESELLAHGGEEHNYFGHSWDSLVKKFLPMQFHPVKYQSFKDYVIEAKWLTAGASSVGRVEVETEDGKKISIKARKNMVADVVDLAKLADDAMAATVQENYTVIKSELGKIRLAVAGDIYTYLKMSWITKLLGGAYYDWPGNTSEEDFEQQTERMAKMLELCSKTLGLPYDYAGFDHQPNTDELIAIAQHLCDHARWNVPETERYIYDIISRNVVNGFRNSTLEVRSSDANEREKFDVTGGLMSGLRWTSTVGNAWNSVMTGLCLMLLESWGISTEKVDRYIRGDDSAIFVPNWATGAAMNIAYDAIGAEGGEGKYSLQYHQMEFLRVWYKDRCYGYPSRALPGLTQRKPWSNEPWSEDMVLRAIHETCRTLKRRMPDREDQIHDLWKALRHVWCRNHNMPDAVAWTPVFQGGFGIEPVPIGERWNIVPPVPKMNKVTGMKVVNQTEWRKNNIKKYAAERYDIKEVSDIDKIAQDELLSTLSSDNIPDVARRLRKEWMYETRATQFRAIRHKEKIAIKPIRTNIASNSPMDIRPTMQLLRAHAPLFGRAPEIETARADYNKFQPKMTFKKWLSLYYTKASALLKRFHRSWHMSEALDYLAGKINLNPTIIHPALTEILALTVAGAYLPRQASTRNILNWAGTAIEPYVWQSQISMRTYRW